MKHFSAMHTNGRLQINAIAETRAEADQLMAVISEYRDLIWCDQCALVSDPLTGDGPEVGGRGYLISQTAKAE